MDKTFHYTSEEMVKELIKLTPIFGSVLDAGSGENKVWYNNLVGEKYECEIEDGIDFFEWTKRTDWIIGNPPFHIGWLFMEKAIKLSNFGIAWLVNNCGMNSLFTPRRLEKIADRGFYLQKMHIVSDKRWFGRYYYLIYTKEPSNIISWNKKTY